MPASPSIPRRRSVYPQAMYTGQLHLKSFSMISKPGRLPGPLPRPRRNTARFPTRQRGSLPLRCLLLTPLNTSEPQQNTPPLFLLPPDIPSAAIKNTWILPLRSPCTTAIPSAHCFGRLPLACSILPAADCDLPLGTLVPCCTPPYTMMESDVLHDIFMHCSRLYHIFASPSASFQADDSFDAHVHSL